jgi:dihydrofolate reductase
MPLKLIYAATADGGIGLHGKPPWPKIGADLQRFRNATLGYACIMGRKTFESLPCALDGRHEVVVSSRYQELQCYHGKKRALFVDSFDTARKCAPDAFVIGGASIMFDAITVADEVYFTLILGEYESDTKFWRAGFDVCCAPEWDCWEETQTDLRCRFYRFRRKE